ncbi:MAG: SH3 domain-containing protein [bacterium]
MVRMTRLVLSAVLLVGAGLLPAGVVVPSAAAQPKRVEPFVVVVTASEVPIRCGDSTLYYPVAAVKSGDALVVDGETAGWLRVQYPAGVEAFVPAEQVTVVQDGAGKLAVPSRLRAPNVNGGVRGSYFQLFEQDLPAGTPLKITRSERGEDGKVTHFAVVPPAGARGWISRDAVRRANEQESARALAGPSAGAPAAVPAPAPAPVPGAWSGGGVEGVVPAPAPVVPAVVPGAGPGTTSSTSAVLGVPASEAGDGGSSAGPAPTPAPSPTPTSAATPAVSAPAASAAVAVAQPVGDEGKDGPFEPVPPPGTTVTRTTTTTTTGALVPGSVGVENLRLNLNQIAETFNRVNKQPLATGEFETAIAQIEGFRATLGTSERDIKLSNALEGYAQALRLRVQLRESQKAGQTAVKEGTLLGTELGKRVVELERQRVYNVIGRLVRSTVYDGDRVPLLYRVMSPEPGAARTLGYLLPSEKFDLVNKLEQVVGIIGEVRPEESLRTNLIIPRRVDVVSLAPIVVSPDIPGVVIGRGGGEAPKTEPVPVAPAAPAVPATPEPEPEKP